MKINNLNSIENQFDVLRHASNIYTKSGQNDLKDYQKKALLKIEEKYLEYLNENIIIKGYSKQDIIKRTQLLNKYFDFIDQKEYKNVFTSQSKFRSTILEEFMYILFNDLIKSIRDKIKDDEELLKTGSTKAYTNLYFSGKNLEEFIKNPTLGINQKDQDFAIYRPLKITIGNSKAIYTNIPIIAIENKTYIDKTMLEGSIATAEKIKSGNPYSLFIIITETYEVKLDVDPIYSKIDQIYVLRKMTKRRENKDPISHEVLIDLVEFVERHLKRDWSDVKNKLEATGKII